MAGDFTDSNLVRSLPISMWSYKKSMINIGIELISFLGVAGRLFGFKALLHHFIREFVVYGRFSPFGQVFK